MGNLHIPLKTLLQAMGLEVVVPPPISKKTLDLGTRVSPEFACLPFKINMGNFLEAVERGAEGVVMAGGVGPCRFGYYAQVQKEILRDLGHEVEMYVVEPPDTHPWQLLVRLSSLVKNNWAKAWKGTQLAWDQARAVDTLEACTHWGRPREAVPGTVDACYQEGLGAVDKAATKDQVAQALEHSLQRIRACQGSSRHQPLRIALVGEIYTVLEPYVNLNLERHLGAMGVEVVRSLFISNWVDENVLRGRMKLPGHHQTRELARPYLGHFVGGHGWETVGGAVEAAVEGLAGVIQVAPLTCMPEIVAQSVLPKVAADYGIPVMTLYVDEQTAEAGLITRLEAFVDMVERRRRGTSFPPGEVGKVASIFRS